MGLFLKTCEVATEVFAFGFSVSKALFVDFEVAPLRERPYYSKRFLVHRDLDIYPETELGAPSVVLVNELQTAVAVIPASSLLTSVHTVIGEIKRQIRLRHSAYYGSDIVLREVGSFLTEPCGGLTESGSADRSRPLELFWETLLCMNIVLACLGGWIGRQTEAGFAGAAALMTLAGYMPVLALALPWFVQGVMRRQPLQYPRRWFWVVWTVWAAVGVLGAINLTRLSLE
jgi:hypothetical protein